MLSHRGPVSSIPYTLLFHRPSQMASPPPSPNNTTYKQALPPDTLQQLHHIGSSSGALLAVLAAAGVTHHRPHDVITTAAAICRTAAVGNRRFGLFGVWGSLLRQLLLQLLPEDSAARCSGGRAAVLTTAYPWLYNVMLREYNSTDDVIRAVLASAHIPLLMDRRWSAPLVGQPAAAAAVAAGSSASQTAAAAAAAVGGSSVSRGWSPRPWMETLTAIDGNFWYMVSIRARGWGGGGGGGLGYRWGRGGGQSLAMCVPQQERIDCSNDGTW